MMASGSVLEVMAVITAVVVGFGELGGVGAGIAILIVGLVLVYVSNFISLILIIKVLHNDNKFLQNYRKKPSPNILIRIISLLTYHKFH